MSFRPRRLYLILGDQLDHASPILAEADRRRDLLWMAEVSEEAEYVWSHRLRLAFFFAAMRHHREHLRAAGWTVRYTALGEDPASDRGRSFDELLRADLAALRPREVVLVECGDHRVTARLEACCAEAEVPLRWLSDTHFLLPLADFRTWASGRRTFLLETFYRMMRQRTGILLDPAGHPEGGSWNFDAENRESFGREGPPRATSFGRHPADSLTREVVAMVESRFAGHPGRIDDFSLPVTRARALGELARFVDERLPYFGRFQDALWKGEDTLYHSRLSAVLNLKLLHPREVIEAALAAYRAGRAPLASVEGFVRQILGWREFVRGIYFFFGEAYLDRNALGAEATLPSFFWDGRTGMACVRDAMENVLKNGYAHHIQRLMVLGQFALLWGVHPRRFHEWHLAMYLDAIDWASAPNTIGMSQYADGGVVGTKPYCASGNYIKRMGNYCAGCVYRPGEAAGERACPFTTLYYDFLDRHRERFRSNQRMSFQLRNLERKAPRELEAIRNRVRWLRHRVAEAPSPAI
jgi:deoxyribodipyrimidine photolyase-related protein